MAKDFYQVLGVKRTATDKEIKASYRKLARQFHPDVNPNDKSAESKFKEISEAFQTLSDPDKRKLYDQFGENYDKIPPGYTGGAGYPGPGGPGPQGVPPDFEELFRQATRGGASNFPGGRVEFRTGPSSGSGGSDGPGIGDLFGEVFGFKGNKPGGFGFGRRRGPQKGPDVEHTLEISLAESVNGTQRRMDLSLRHPESDVAEKRAFTVKIPAGVAEGATVKVAGQGSSGEGGGPNGDIYLRIRITPDKFWKREGNDIKIEVPVTMTEAALGAQIQVPTLTGEVTLRIPPGTQSGQAIRLSGRGVKNPKTGASGDQYVLVKVVVPRSPSAREKELLEELAALNRENVRESLPRSFPGAR